MFIPYLPIEGLHDFNLDWFFKKFRELLTDFEDLRNATDEELEIYKTKLEQMYNMLEGMDIPYPFLEKLGKLRAWNNAFEGANNNMWYVDADNGSDENSGRSWEDAFQTIGHACQTASTMYCDIRIRAKGICDCSDLNVFTNSGLHILAAAPNTKLLFTKHNAPFYDSHLNLQGYTDENNVKHPLEIIVNVPGAANNLFYIDGGTMVADNVDFNCQVQNNGGWMRFRNCIIHNYDSQGAVASFEISNDFGVKKRGDRPMLFIREGSTVALSDDIYLHPELVQTGDFIHCSNSKISMMGADFVDVPEDTGDFYAGRNYFNFCELIIQASLRKKLDNMALSGLYMGPIVLMNNTALELKSNGIVTPTQNSWTELAEINLKAGYYVGYIELQTLQNELPITSARSMNLRFTIPNNNINYDSMEVHTNINSFRKTFFYCGASSDFSIPFEIQNGNTVPIHYKIFVTRLS